MGGSDNVGGRSDTAGEGAKGDRSARGKGKVLKGQRQKLLHGYAPEARWSGTGALPDEARNLARRVPMGS